MSLNKGWLFFAFLILSQQIIAAETLEQAFIVAITNNQQISAAQANNKAAEQQLFATQGQRHPQLNISTGYKQLSNTPSTNTNNGGQTTQFSTAQKESLTAQAMIILPIFTSGRISHNINAAKAIKQATMQNKQATILNIKLQVANAFIAIFRAATALEVANTHVRSLKAHANDAKNRYQQGMVARNDLLASQVKLSNANQIVLQQQNTLDIAKAKFNQLLNRALTTEVTLLEQSPEIPPGTLFELTQQALIQRPELHALSEQVLALNHQASSEVANLLPQVNISGGYQYEENKHTTYENMLVANVTLNWKLFDGSTRHYSSATKHKSLAVKMQRNNLIGQIKLQIRQAWLDINETMKLIQVAQQAINQANENLKVSSERYQQGLSNNTEVFDAEDLRVQANNNLNNAQYDAIMAKLNMRYALGIL